MTRILSIIWTAIPCPAAALSEVQIRQSPASTGLGLCWWYHVFAKRIDLRIQWSDVPKSRCTHGTASLCRAVLRPRTLLPGQHFPGTYSGQPDGKVGCKDLSAPLPSLAFFLTSRLWTSPTWTRTGSRTSASPSSAPTMAPPPALSQLPALAGSSAHRWRLTSQWASPISPQRPSRSPSSTSSRTSHGAQPFLFPVPACPWLQRCLFTQLRVSLVLWGSAWWPWLGGPSEGGTRALGTRPHLQPPPLTQPPSTRSF